MTPRMEPLAGRERPPRYAAIGAKGVADDRTSPQTPTAEAAGEPRERRTGRRRPWPRRAPARRARDPIRSGRSPSRRAPPRRPRCWSAETPSTRGCSRTSPLQRPPCTSTSSASDRGTWATSSRPRSTKGHGPGCRSGSSSTGRAPTRARRRRSTSGSAPRASRSASSGDPVRGPLGRSATAPPPLEPGLGSATSTTARSSSLTGASAGSAVRGSRTTSRTGGSTTCSCGLEGPVVGTAPARLPRQRPLARGSMLTTSTPSSRRPSPGGDPVPAIVLHNAPGPYRPITDAIATLLDGASETLDVVNPYVTDRGMIRRIEAGRTTGRPRAFLRPAEANNGLAPQRSSSTTGVCSTRASASSSTPRC